MLQDESQVDAVTVTGGLACDQHPYRMRTSVECLMRLVRRDFNAFPGLKNDELLFDFEGQNSIEDVEELSCMQVVVATLTCAGWHEFFDDTKVGRLDQMPAVGTGSEIATPLVVVGGLCADDAYRHRETVPIFSDSQRRALRRVPHAEHMEVLETTLEDIDQLVISVWIGRPKEEACLEHEVPRITNDSLDHLAIVEVDAHPETGHDRRMFVEVESSVAKITVEGLNEEDCLRVLGGHVLDGF